MKYPLLFLIAAGCLLGCNNTSNLGKTGEDSDSLAGVTAARDSIVVLDSITLADTSAAILPGDDPVIQVTVPAETLPVTRLQRAITSDMQSIRLSVTDLDVGQLRVSVAHSKPDANIRISQIIRPDGSMDGPYGQQLVYDIKQRGTYTIIINKSNMASGTQVGDVFITLER